MEPVLTAKEIEALRIKLTLPQVALTTSEAAYVLGKTTPAMISDRGRGRGPRFIKGTRGNPQGHVRYVVRDVLDYLNGGNQKQGGGNAA